VALPALSRLAPREELYRNAIFALFERLAMVTMPGAALVAVTGDYVCSILFGPHWLTAAPIVTCFGVAAISQPVIIASGLLYVPQGRPKELFRASLIDSAMCIISFFIGLPWGAIGVATSFAAIGLAVRLPVSFWLSTRVGPVRYGELCATVYPALIASVAVAAVVGALHMVANEVAPASVIGDSAAMIVTAFLVVGTTYMLIPRSRRTLLSFVRIAPLVQGTSKP
jgi:PST family polysaccharide transporter